MTDGEKVTLIETEQRSKSNTHRIENIEIEMKEMKNDNKAMYELATSVRVMAERQGNMEDKLDEISDKVDETSKAQKDTEVRFLQKINEVENKPNSLTADNVNKIKVSIITAIFTFLATGALGAIIYFVKQ